MSENTLPLETLIDVFWQKEDTSTSFARPDSPEAKRELLRQIACSVFKRQRIVLIHELKASQVLELIALIISKTYSVRGDSFQVADDEALMRISDLLLELDPNIIRRYSRIQITEQQFLRRLKENAGSIE
jgi:hypothetical protein